MVQRRQNFRHGGDAALSDQLQQQWVTVPLGLGQKRNDLRVDFPPWKISQRLLRRLRQVPVGLDRNFEQRGKTRCVSHAPQRINGRHSHLLVAPFGGFQHRSQDDGLLAVGHGLNHQGGSCGCCANHLGGESLVHFAARKLARGAQCELKQALVRRAELFQQQWNPLLLPSENRAARRLDDSLLRNISAADLVVNLRRFGPICLRSAIARHTAHSPRQLRNAL